MSNDNKHWPWFVLAALVVVSSIAWSIGGSWSADPDAAATIDAADSTRHRARRGRGLGRGSLHGSRRSAASTPSEPVVAAVDPQERASARSYSMTPDAGTLPPFAPSLHLGRVARTDGDSPVNEGDRCELRVLPVASNGFNCLVRVMCGDVVVYPDAGQTAGYAPCEVDRGLVTRALDEGISSEDGDPIVDVDLGGRQVLVADDGPMGRRFSATIQLRSI